MVEAKSWDLSVLARESPALSGTCPRCDAYLHPYCTTCFGCGQERGSAFRDIIQMWEIITRAPLDLIRSAHGPAGTYLDNIWELRAKARASGLDTQEERIRPDLWSLSRHAIPQAADWSGRPAEVTKYLYVGGLEAHPQPENALLLWQNRQFVIQGERSRQQIATIPPSRILSASAHATLDEMLGGLTFGFFTGSAAVFQSMRPTQGGLMKIIFADEDGLWRLAALGNRTGLTDKRYAFAYYEACASLIGATAGYHATMQEWALGPRAYALSIGMAPPAIPASAAVEVVGETKLCPDCGETVKAMARVCRFCRYEFRSDGPDPASPHEPEAATAALDQMDLNEAAALFEYTYVAIEDIVTDDLAPAVTPVVDLDALGLWGETSLAPLREHREAIARLRIGIPEIQDLADRIDAALVAYIHAATLARDRSPDAVQALTAATASWQHVQAKVG